jgi:hypothetical protein
MDQCHGCNISFIPLHYYGPPDQLQPYIEQMHNTYNSSRLWVTEFGFPGLDEPTSAAALSAAITFLDNANYIDRYAYFPMYRSGDTNYPYVGPGGAVLNDDGSPTQVGQVWLGNGSQKNRKQRLRLS